MGDLKFQLQHYASEMWRRKWSILLVGLLVGLLGTYVAATRPDVFTSRAAVEVDENALLIAVSPRGAPRTDTAAAIDSVRRGIYARPNLEQIIYDTDLHLTLEDQRGWESMVTDLEENLELKRQGPNFYIIEYTHNDPVVARNVTQAALDLFLEKGTEGVGSSEGTKKEEARRYLETSLEGSLGDLDKIQAQIATYQRENPDIDGGAAVQQSQLRGLQSQLSSLNSDRLLYQSEVSNLRSQLSSMPREIVVRQVQTPGQRTPMPIRPNVTVPTGPTQEQQRADAFEQQVSGLRSELQTMLETKTPQHPDVITMQTRLNAVESQLAGLRAAAQGANGQLQAEISRANQIMQQYEADMRIWQFDQSAPQPLKDIYGPNPRIPELTAQVADRQGRLNITESQIASLRAEVQKIQATLSKQPERLQAYSKLKTDEDRYLREVASLKEKIALLGPKNLNRVNMAVIEPPIVPVTPAGPNRLLLFMAAFMLAAGSGMGLAFMRVQFADNIPTIKHLKQSFDLPILGGVSMIESKADNARAAAGNLVYLASVAALIAVFGYVTYRFHFELWRPDFAGLMAKLGAAPTPRG